MKKKPTTVAEDLAAGKATAEATKHKLDAMLGTAPAPSVVEDQITAMEREPENKALVKIERAADPWRVPHPRRRRPPRVDGDPGAASGREERSLIDWETLSSPEPSPAPTEPATAPAPTPRRNTFLDGILKLKVATEKKIVANPWKSVLIAFGAGVGVGTLGTYLVMNGKAKRAALAALERTIAAASPADRLLVAEVEINRMGRAGLIDQAEAKERLGQLAIAHRHHQRSVAENRALWQQLALAAQTANTAATVAASSATVAAAGSMGVAADRFALVGDRVATIGDRFAVGVDRVAVAADRGAAAADRTVADGVLQRSHTDGHMAVLGQRLDGIEREVAARPAAGPDPDVERVIDAARKAAKPA